MALGLFCGFVQTGCEALELAPGIGQHTQIAKLLSWLTFPQNVVIFDKAIQPDGDIGKRGIPIIVGCCPNQRHLGFNGKSATGRKELGKLKFNGWLAVNTDDNPLNSERKLRGIDYFERNIQDAAFLPRGEHRPVSAPVLDIYPLSEMYFLQIGASFHFFGSTVHFSRLTSDDAECDDSHYDQRPLGGCVPLWRLGLFAVAYLCGTYINCRADRLSLRITGGCAFYCVGALLAFGPWGKVNCQTGQHYCSESGIFHRGEIVTQKHFTSCHLCNTVNVIGGLNPMANILNTGKQIAVIGALAEGSSIRSIERITGVHRDTIMRLGVKIGQGCTALMDAKLRDLSCNRLEMDEIWGFVGKKDRNVRMGDSSQVGSVWTFCAIDAETKLVPAFKVGGRDRATANAFVQDVASRMRNRVQISTDGLRAYVEAVEESFGADVDFAQIVKTYGREEVSDNRRYSAPEFVSSEKKVITGNPNERLISTSYIERLNATTRLHMRRLTRLTLAFSKKRENFEAAVGLHFAYYNFVKRHNTLRCTPAMAAGVERDFWSVGQLIEAAA